MFSKLVLVGLGGAAGCMLRYLCQKGLNAGFPAGTLLVNLTGCLLIGLLWGVLSKGPETGRLLLMTGFCGGFTTFSAFTQETVQMLLGSQWLKAAVYTGLSVVAGLLATLIGFKITS